MTVLTSGHVSVDGKRDSGCSVLIAHQGLLSAYPWSYFPQTTCLQSRPIVTCLYILNLEVADIMASPWPLTFLSQSLLLRLYLWERPLPWLWAS